MRTAAATFSAFKPPAKMIRRPTAARRGWPPYHFSGWLERGECCRRRPHRPALRRGCRQWRRIKARKERSRPAPGVHSGSPPRRTEIESSSGRFTEIYEFHPPITNDGEI